jgi:hypothetical protein
VIELEALALGVTGKLALWRALEDLADERPDVIGFDLPVLIERAERQRDELEAWRLQAVAEAFAAPG